METEVIVAALALYRTADVIIQQYGSEDALLFAAKRAEAFLSWAM